MENLKYFLNRINVHKVKIGVVLLIGCVFFILLNYWDILLMYYESTACWMYGKSAEANGKLMTLIVSIIGGVWVIYGLILNSRRVKEQTRQNDIAVQYNNDKRFGEAIGYLNSDNNGIVTGGIYALYQLAKEDKRYVPIVANIFVDYVNGKKGKKGTEIILDLIFSKEENGSVWGKYVFNFKDIELVGRTLYCNNYKVNFDGCSLSGLYIVGDDNIFFNRCNLNSVHILKFKLIYILYGNIEYSNIIGLEAIKTEIRLCATKVIHTHIDADIVSKLDVSPDYLENVVVKANSILKYYIDEKTKIGDGDKLCVFAKNIAINPRSNHNRIETEKGKIVIIQSDKVEPDIKYKECIG